MTAVNAQVSFTFRFAATEAFLVLVRFGIASFLSRESFSLALRFAALGRLVAH